MTINDALLTILGFISKNKIRHNNSYKQKDDKAK